MRSMMHACGASVGGEGGKAQGVVDLEPRGEY